MNKFRKTVIFLALAASLPMFGQSSQVLLETTEGNILLTLYDDTPLHRDNFLRLVDNHFYDSLLFHRVIKGFMIQGGDPASRHAEPGTLLGGGDTGYTIKPELFAPDGRLLHFHRRGALAMAREGDYVNPERRSSGCQFYIVWGTTISSNELESISKKNDMMTQHQGLMTPEMTDIYRRIGGAPHLDGQYTVFGEVTEGFDVVKRIQEVITDDYNRPVDGVRIICAQRK